MVIDDFNGHSETSGCQEISMDGYNLGRCAKENYRKVRSHTNTFNRWNNFEKTSWARFANILEEEIKRRPTVANYDLIIKLIKK